MLIDRNHIYVYGKYTYVNFVLLSQAELLEVLGWRNHPSVRKYLNNNDLIQENEHLSFCYNLNNNNEKFYWLVKKNNKPIGVLNIINVDYSERTCESGFYLVPDLLGSGEGLFVMRNYKTFLLKELKFKAVYGHNFYDNMSALIITMFLGAKINNVRYIDAKLCIETIITDESLQNEEGSQKLLPKFSAFLKEWNADQIISNYRNGE